MISVEALRKEKFWDHRYDLPLCPKLNNPWLYCAYILKLAGLRQNPDVIEKCDKYAAMCALDIPKGYFTRWPDRSGGDVSHDEIIGKAYLCKQPVVKELLGFLYERDGIFNPNDTIIDSMFRFIFLEPFLKARCLFSNALGQFKWAAHVVFSALTYKSGSSGPLKIWLMAEEMCGYWVCRWAYSFWKNEMANHGVTLEWLISEHFPDPDYYILHELADEVSL